MTTERSSYRQIFKATSLFGGVQVFQILIGIVRVKFVAVLLGTTGVGMIKLFNAPIELIMSITGLGIAFSAVKYISEAKEHNDDVRFSKVIMTVRRWSWFAGLLGAVVTLILSPLLSKWSFGDKEYTWAFIWLSVTLMLKAISKSEAAILQGTRRLKNLAKAGVLGSLVGLFTSVPLYYLFGLKGIVPSLIITAITALALNLYFAGKVKIATIQMTLKETIESGTSMAKLGISMTLAGFLTAFSTYVLSAFLSNRTGIEEVGLYNAGWGVVGQYTGLVFTAMAMDYFPRLSTNNKNNEKISSLVHQQSESALLILTPFLTLLIFLMPVVIRILYTTEFLPVVTFASLIILGMQFKVGTWAMGYVILAKGSGLLFLKMEVISSLIALINNLLGYYYFGLNGLGYSFIVNYIIGYLITSSIVKSRYNIAMTKDFYRKLILSILFSVIAFISTYLENVYIKYSSGTVIFILSALFSISVLNRRMDVIAYLREIFKKQ